MRRRDLCLVSVSFAAMAAWSAPATAQAPAPGDASEVTVGEVVVTARRREERLVDVPTAASIIDGAQLAERGGAGGSGELLATQPSVRFNNLTSTLTSEISMRASSTARATNGDPSVGLYRNGAYVGGGAIGGRNFSRLDFFDIGRVEVLRGTQGALYGRNAVGGAVNIVSARPEFDHEGYVDLRYGFDNESLQLQGAANLALSDTFALRIGADYIDQDGGFFYNPQNGVYFDRTSGLGLRGQLRYANGPLDVNLLAESQQATIPTVIYRLYIPAGTPGFPGGYIQPQYSYGWSTRPRAEQDIDAVTLSVDYDLGWGRLTSTSMYRERDSEYDLDSDGINAVDLAAARAAGQVGPLTPVDPGAAAYVVDVTRTWSQDIHLSGAALEGRLDWLVGAEAMSQKSAYSVSAAHTPTAANPSIGTYAPAVLTYESVAMYGSLNYAVTEAFSLAGELRYTRDDKSISARLYDRGSGAAVGGPARVIDASNAPSNVSYNLTGSYDLPMNLMVYAKVGTSYRAGGFNTNLGDLRQPVPIQAGYDDETSTSWELGLKGAPRRGLYVAVAGYRNDLKDMIAQVDNGCALSNPVCPVASTSFLTNVGKAKSWGVEAEVIGRAHLFGGLLRVAFSGSRQGGQVTSGVFDGVNLPQVPDWLASADLSYRRPFIGGSEVFGNILYTAQWGGAQEMRATSVPLDDYGLLNLRLGVAAGPVVVTAFVDNVADQTYLLAQDASIRRYNQPRLTGLQMRYRW